MMVIEGLQSLFVELVSVASNPTIILYILFGAFVGMVFGAIPGITATTAVILMIPVTYYMPLDTALALLLATFKGGMFGGSISSVLLGCPGSPGAVATSFDGYPMGQQGKGLKAIRMSLYASVTGDTSSDIITVILAPVLGALALKLGPPEIFLVVVVSIILVGTLSGSMRALETGSASTAKAVISGMIGVTLVMVGMEPLVGSPRLTFGYFNLMSGFVLVPVFLGLFGVARALSLLSEPKTPAGLQRVHIPPPLSRDDTRVSLREYLQCWKVLLYGTFIGTLLGAAPGLGPNAAGLVAHGQGKFLARDKANYGKGSLEGVAVAESANSAVYGANLLPLVTLGIPGSVEAAVLLGAFMLHGIQIGPLLIVNYPELIYRIFAAMLLANVATLLVGYVATPVFIRMVTVPRNVLLPVVLMLCFIGTWIRAPITFHLWVMIAFGVIGYLMEKSGFSLASLTIGFVLGRQLEMGFNQTKIIARGDYWSLLSRTPLVVLIIILAVGAVVLATTLRKTKVHKVGGC